MVERIYEMIMISTDGLTLFPCQKHWNCSGHRWLRRESSQWTMAIWSGFQLSIQSNSRLPWFLQYCAERLAQKNSPNLFSQSEVKPKPIVPRSHAFSSVSPRPHVFASSFDWFTGLVTSFVIGQWLFFFFFYETQFKIILLTPCFPKQVQRSISAAARLVKDIGKFYSCFVWLTLPPNSRAHSF